LLSPLQLQPPSVLEGGGVLEQALRGGLVPGARPQPCDDATCPPNSFCTADLLTGGSHCPCSLGKGGHRCGTDISIQYPRFSGHSYLTFEPLKNSYQRTEITLQFKADGEEDGLLLYCGETETGRGDFLSLAIVRGRLQYRFDCGTGATVLQSEGPVQPAAWHTVTARRDGRNGSLQIDAHTPLTGSTKGSYSRITFRTPLYVGGGPGGWGLSAAAGTHQGLRGCLQALVINGRRLSLRPWPHGEALSGADVGECSAGLCRGVVCANGGSCVANSADSYLCLCPLGYRGRHCQEAVTEAIEIPQFIGRSYLTYDHQNFLKRVGAG
ncbi:pikachurin-like, partial [Amblyraja radiata]|uniref:pikachurin-like n=1 Tax=Amblyraja radiata TaxID=386614 RepID=UPI001403A460